MYIQIDRDDIWNVYTKPKAPEGLFRGGGNKASPKMYKTENGKDAVRPADFNIQYDKAQGEYRVYPDVTKRSLVLKLYTATEGHTHPRESVATSARQETT